MTTIACNAPYGVGGLGRHLAQFVEGARAEGTLRHYYASAILAGDEQGRDIRTALVPPLTRWTPIRFSPGGRAYIAAEMFDRAVARALEPGDSFVGFAGHALHSFERARQLGFSRLELVSPTAHADLVRRRHDEARIAHPVESSWLSNGQRRKCLREYELADVVHVGSEYVRRSFVEAGFPDERLHSHRLEADQRFAPHARSRDGLFRVVYVGGLTIAKGVPVLLDAFERFPEPEARLVLVGGWSSRGMRKFVESRLRHDARISVQPGDPLPHLQHADVYVHPSRQDGFGLAPAEAMACGVPVVVTADTGMKERIHEGVDGWIVPTGDAAAITARLFAIRDASRVAAAGGGTAA